MAWFDPTSLWHRQIYYRSGHILCPPLDAVLPKPPLNGAAVFVLASEGKALRPRQSSVEGSRTFRTNATMKTGVGPEIRVRGRTLFGSVSIHRCS